MTQPLLDFIRNTLSAKYRLMALTITTRSNAQYFRNSENKILGLLVGVLDCPIKYDTTLPEPVQLSSFLKNGAEIIPGPYRGFSAETPPPKVLFKARADPSSG